MQFGQTLEFASFDQRRQRNTCRAFAFHLWNSLVPGMQLGIMRDISERKLAEIKLKQAIDELDAIFESRRYRRDRKWC